MKNQNEFNAFYLKKALSENEANVKILIEILSFKNNTQMLKIKLKYESSIPIFIVI